MKRLFSLIASILMFIPVQVKAQTENSDSNHLLPATDTLAAMPASSIADAPSAFSLPLPIVDIAAPAFGGTALWGTDYGFDWRLHEGFNAQLSMSLTAALGKNAPRGVGFGQSAAFAYAVPLSQRFSAAVGVYADNLNWGGCRSTDGGVAATLCYRVNDAVNLYAYAAKSFLPKSRRFWYGFSPYGLPQPKDRVGAMAEFKMGKNAMIQVSIEKRGY